MIEQYNTIVKPRCPPLSDEGGDVETVITGAVAFLSYLGESHNLTLTGEQEAIVERVFTEMESLGEVDIINFEVQLLLSKEPEFSISERSTIVNGLDQYLMRSITAY